MPIASKRRTEARKETPIEPEAHPRPEQEEQPAPPKVTALVFSYDSAPALRRCLAALEASNDRSALEILVVDCGSHDESPQLDSEFPQATFLRLPRYFGRTKAWNIGTRTANAELLLFLSPEVEVLPTTVPSLIARLESDPDAVAVAPLLLDTEGKTTSQFFRLPTPQTGIELAPVEVDTSSDAVTVEFASLQALLVRKYFVRGINYLDERYGESFADAELAYQIRRASRKTLVLPPVTALFTPMSPYSASAHTVLIADRVHGAAVYFEKHYGFVSGLLFRIKSVLSALFTLRIGLFGALISGSKIDGSQTVIL